MSQEDRRFCDVPCQKYGRGDEASSDFVAVEEPLEILVDGTPVSVVMRTPGDDEVLVLGFLLTEGVIESLDQVEGLSAEYGDNRMAVFLRDGVSLDLERLSRHVFSASSCGICGKASIDAVMRDLAPIAEMSEVLSQDVLLSSVDKLEVVQKTFIKTGGLHAAAIFSLTGELLVMHEDVGRHNAVDKVIGESSQRGVDLGQTYLLVSGRVSFEIMQKSLAAKIPCLAAVSAPSSLAVSFAQDANQTLVGFLRAPKWNLYNEGSLKVER